MSTTEPQVLTLAVTGSQAAALGARSRKSFAAKDGSIGRAEDCDWTLSAAGVSRVHAMVRYVNGLYFVEDRSTNGMLLNGTPLIKGDPTPLKEGDVLRIDNFDIAVHLEQDTETVMHAAAPPAPPAESAAVPPAYAPDAFAMPPPPPARNDLLDFDLGAPLPGVPPARGGAPAESLIPAGGAGGGGSLIPDAPVPGGGSLDPLSFLDAPLAPEPAAPAPAQDWNHSSSMDDHFQPPATDVQRAASTLPDDWDPLAPEAPAMPSPAAAPAPRAPWPPAPAAPAAAPRAPQIPDGPLGWPPAPAAEPSGPSAGPAIPESPAAWPPPAAPAAPPPQAPPGIRQAPPAARPAPPMVAPAAAAPARPSPELDAIFHIVVDGVMDVLRARAEIKNTFRLPVTVIQRSENNPLKFALGTDEAIAKILSPPDPAFLTGPAAFEDAFDDIRSHQMAMLAGVRAGFDAVLRHFDPEHFDREGESSRYGFGGKGKHWERFREHYQSLVADPDACFRRLFGDEFARAYEEQLARLKSARRAQRPRPG